MRRLSCEEIDSGYLLEVDEYEKNVFRGGNRSRSRGGTEVMVKVKVKANSDGKALYIFVHGLR